MAPEETPFANRDPKEFGCDLSPGYAIFFEKILGFARELFAGDGPPQDANGLPFRCHCHFLGPAPAGNRLLQGRAR